MRSRRRMLSWLFSLAVAAAWQSPALAQVWQAGPAPTIGALTSQTVETIPTPRTRTTIGIREQVTVSVDAASWNDVDYKVTASGQEPVQDTPIGTVTWSVIGSGTVDPPTGNSTTFKAPKRGGASTVRASIDDSNTKGNDDPIPKSIDFTVKEPDGAIVSNPVDSTAGWTAGPPNAQIGNKTKFTIQVTPTTVNFRNVPFHTKYPYLANDVIAWPDGTKEPFAVTGYDFSVANSGTTPNIYEQELVAPQRPIVRIAGAAFTWTITYSYKFDGGGTGADQWVSFKTGTSDRIYAANGACTLKLSINNFLSGTAKGPWQ